MTAPDRSPDTIHYFAYGSNLCTAQMREVLGRIPRSVIARLRDYRFAFNIADTKAAEVYGNLMPQDGSEIWGVLYECGRADIEKLDQFEDLASSLYSRQRIVVVMQSQKPVEAEAYFAGRASAGPEQRPSAEYARKIISGAREHGLPPHYVNQLEELAGLTLSK